MSDQPKIFYRYEGYEHLTVDRYAAIGETEHTCMIIPLRYYDEWKRYATLPFWVKPKRVFKKAHRSFAYQDIEKARESYIARKKWQITHLDRQMKRAYSGLCHAEKGLFDDRAMYEQERLSRDIV